MNGWPSLEEMPKSSRSSMTMMIAELPGSLMVRGADGGFSVTFGIESWFHQFHACKTFVATWF